jgi:hypothetical protein
MGYDLIKEIAKHRQSGAGAAAVLPVLLWSAQAVLSSVPAPPTWVYVGLGCIGAALFNEITD